MRKKLTDLLLSILVVTVAFGLGIAVTDGILRLLMIVGFGVVILEIVISVQKLILEGPEALDSGTQKQTTSKQNDEDAAWFAEHQNLNILKRMKIVGILLNGISICVGLITVSHVEPYEFWSVACILCFCAGVFLNTRFPAYFSMGESNEKRKERCGASAVNLIVAYLIPLACCMLRALSEFGIPHWVQMFQVVFLIALIITIFHQLFVREFQSDFRGLIAILLFFMIFSFGVALSLNHVLSFVEPQTISGIVIERDAGYKTVPSFTVMIDGGEEVYVPAGSWTRYSEYSIGDRVELEYNTGALGIDYYYFSD